MGNDDITVFDGIAHLRIIDVSCPRQLLSIMRWIMRGNRGLVYLRVMRAQSAVLYGEEFEFEFGTAYTLRESPNDSAVIVTSNRGAHEALAVSILGAEQQLSIGVVDMPSIDNEKLLHMYDSGKLLCFSEQNNGYLWQNFLKLLYRHRRPCEWNRVLAINTLDVNGRPRFIIPALMKSCWTRLPCRQRGSFTPFPSD